MNEPVDEADDEQVASCLDLTQARSQSDERHLCSVSMLRSSQHLQNIGLQEEQMHQFCKQATLTKRSR